MFNKIKLLNNNAQRLILDVAEQRRENSQLLPAIIFHGDFNWRLVRGFNFIATLYSWGTLSFVVTFYKQRPLLSIPAGLY